MRRGLRPERRKGPVNLLLKTIVGYSGCNLNTQEADGEPQVPRNASPDIPGPTSKGTLFDQLEEKDAIRREQAVSRVESMGLVGLWTRCGA